MTEREFHLLMLSPMAISLSVAKMRPEATRADVSAWISFYIAAERAVDPLPPEPAVPLLRWIAKPPDYDPTWTVAELSWATWMRIGAHEYHHVTGRCRTGRATSHGRLWNPREQEEAWRRWIADCHRPKAEREQAMASTMAMHRAAVADRLERYASTYRHRRIRDYTIRAYPNPLAERVKSDMPESRVRTEFLSRSAWLNLTAYRTGYGYVMSVDLMSEFVLVQG